MTSAEILAAITDTYHECNPCRDVESELNVEKLADFLAEHLPTEPPK